MKRLGRWAMNMSCGHEIRRKVESEGWMVYIHGEGISLVPCFVGGEECGLCFSDSWRICFFLVLSE